MAAGNEICADANAEAQAAAQDTFANGEPSPDELEQFVQDTVIPSVGGQISDLEALGAPEGDEDQVNAIIDAVQQGLDEVEADPQAILQGPFDEANRLAVDYGLTDCAS